MQRQPRHHVRQWKQIDLRSIFALIPLAKTNTPTHQTHLPSSSSRRKINKTSSLTNNPMYLLVS